jgi:hypothetical protein
MNITYVIKDAASVNQKRANPVITPENADARREQGARTDMKKPNTLKMSPSK